MNKQSNQSKPTMSTRAADRRIGAATGAAVARSARTAAEIYVEQVAMLYAGARTAALANMANAAILTLLLWSTAPARLLHGWLGIMVIVQLSRLGLAYMYQRARPSVDGIKAARWDQWYLAGVVASGAMWGAAGFWLFPQQAVELQFGLIFLLAGTVAGATALLAPVLSAFPLFALPALVPLGIRFLLEGTPHYMVMAALTLIFLLVLLNVVRIIHAPIVSSIRLRMENSDLVAALTSRASNLQQVNRLQQLKIAERTVVHDQLGDQLFFLKELMDSIPSPVFYKDTQSVFLGCNKAFETFYGLSRADIVGKTVFDIFPKEVAEVFHRADLNLADQNKPQNLETDLKAADGSLRHVLVQKSLYRSPLGSVIGQIGVFLDVTDLKRKEALLLQSQERLRLALKAGNVGLWSWDLKTNEVYISPSWKAQLGYTDEEIQNRYEEFESRVHPDDLALVRQQNMAFIKTPSSGYASEFRLRHKDGSYRWIFARADIYKDAEGQPAWFTGCNIDITERKRAEEALRRETRHAGIPAGGTREQHA